MIRRWRAFIFGTAAAVLLLPSAQAAPMRCADLKSACVAACAKVSPGIRGACLSNCNARQVNCQQTGCWNDGSSNLCGVQRR